jgi:anti-anti-sigma factor
MADVSISRHTVNDGVLCLAVTGEVDLSSCDRVAAAIGDAILTRHIAEVVVDLDGVRFLDSSGVHVLVAGYHLAAQHCVRYVIANPRDLVRKVLAVTGVLTVLTAPSEP